MKHTDDTDEIRGSDAHGQLAYQDVDFLKPMMGVPYESLRSTSRLCAHFGAPACTTRSCFSDLSESDPSLRFGYTTMKLDSQRGTSRAGPDAVLALDAHSWSAPEVALLSWSQRIAAHLKRAVERSV